MMDVFGALKVIYLKSSSCVYEIAKIVHANINTHMHVHVHACVHMYYAIALMILYT